MQPSLTPPTHLVGQQFGWWTVLELQRVHNGREYVYKAVCRCACGKEKVRLLSTIKGGYSKSCGCNKESYAKRTGPKHGLFQGHGEIGISLWNRYRQHAGERGRAFEVTIESAWAVYLKQGRKCALSGEPIIFGSLSSHAKTCERCTASLDRIDPSKGYVEGNIQWVHKTVNIMRNVLSVEDFVFWCNRIGECADSRAGVVETPGMNSPDSHI